MDKNIKLSIQQAKDLYKSNPEYRNTLLSVFTDVELGIEPIMKSWDELYMDLCGFYISSDSEVKEVSNISLNLANRNIFKTEKQARSSLAMAQLSQLMAYLGDECDVDWNDASLKCTIYKFQNSIRADINRHMYQFLAFKTAKVRDAFLEKHKELIKDYLMI